MPPAVPDPPAAIQVPVDYDYACDALSLALSENARARMRLTQAVSGRLRKSAAGLPQHEIAGLAPDRSA